LFGKLNGTLANEVRSRNRTIPNKNRIKGHLLMSQSRNNLLTNN
jgi:hypothetical protein